MNLGKRIEARLNDLEKGRQWLLDQVEGLTDQALSNLIRRDSRRSEWDEKIADALGVSVLWLVYGREDRPTRDLQQTIPPYGNVQPMPPASDPTIDEVVRIMQATDATGRAMALAAVRVALNGYTVAQANLAN